MPVQKKSGNLLKEPPTKEKGEEIEKTARGIICINKVIMIICKSLKF